MSLPFPRPVVASNTNTYLSNVHDFASFAKPNLGFQIARRNDSRCSNESWDSTIDDSPRKESHRSFSSNSDVIFNSPEAKSVTSNENNEETYTVLNSALQQKRKMVTDDSKFKTELCKNYSETGQCPYGKKCKFAHGRSELNEKRIQTNGRYKSKKCASFHNQMYCCYGVRCLFAHEQRNMRELITSSYYEKYSFCPGLLNFPLTQKNRRLPVFQAASDNSNNQQFSLKSITLEENEFSSF